MSQIALADLSALLDHADAIDFFEQPEPVPAGPFNRIFHLTITAGNWTRELAINDPFETPELAYLITLTQRAVRDRQVLSFRHGGQRTVRRIGSGTAGRTIGHFGRRSEPLTNRINA